MRMAMSAISRMREWGTARAEGETWAMGVRSNYLRSRAGTGQTVPCGCFQKGWEASQVRAGTRPRIPVARAMVRTLSARSTRLRSLASRHIGLTASFLTSLRQTLSRPPSSTELGIRANPYVFKWAKALPRAFLYEVFLAEDNSRHRTWQYRRSGNP